jgi:photosystem II stability/assembly factor-like uncharacterized protein
MSVSRSPVQVGALVLAAVLSLGHPSASARAQALDPSLYSGLRWRMIGPHRGGRTKAVVGVPQEAGLFYAGFVNGGVWRTTDFGRTWVPIFDDQPTGSVGALAVAPSDPDVIYVGSGEGMQRPDLTTGDGIYKSTDGGETWTHLGLRDGQQIPQIIVDPSDPQRVFVAVLGHPYGPNEERGVFRSTDGGRSFEKVLYKDEDTGAAEVAFDPSDPRTVYAVLWEARQGPWENGVFSGPGSGLFKSTDGGTSWRRIGEGLPTGEEGLGRIGIGIAPSEPSRIYAIVSAPARLGGVYRSDDAGERWRRIHTDSRLWGRDGDFNEVKVDPQDPDVVYVANIVTWKSTDGGFTFDAFRGAPGGDDYQRIWIHPRDPRIIALAADQGVIITVNGGETFSSWYNQPTAQFYHVTTDNAFPYRVCGGQQESGSACVSSRGNDGQITFGDWHPVGVEEYGYVAPDPLNPDIVYGGKVTRFDRRTGDRQNVTPAALRGGDYRTVRTQPILFSPADPHTLFFASNTLWKTRDGGHSWEQISPDLTRTDSLVPPNVGKYASSPEALARHPGVIYTIAPSYLNERWIWVGTDDGLIHVTSDGGESWRDVTPPELRAHPWSKISIMDAGRFDTLTAYAAVNTFRLDDLRPHIYRTHDGGRSWTRIVNGIPDGGVTNVVREDPVRMGLLYAGTEQAVYVSFDDGEYWSSLRQNMPATSIRDLVVKDNDLVVGTHGRSFWILDDVSPLRELGAGTAPEAAVLFEPGEAWRVRWNRWTDTPLPQEEPAGENPPDGAILYYWLGTAPRAPVVLEIRDENGGVVRRYASDHPPEEPLEGQNVPPYWIRPFQPLSAEVGMHRFIWDLHYPPPEGVRFSYPISAIHGNTAPVPTGPWVLPGQYTVRLTVDGRELTQPLTVRMDPRVDTPAAALREQFRLSMELYDGMAWLTEAAAQDEDRSREMLALHRDLSSLYNLLQGSDGIPTTQALEAVGGKLDELERMREGR